MFRTVSFLMFLLSVAHAAPKPDFGDINKPDFFPILPWEPIHGWNDSIATRPINGLESIAECNFNFAGFVLPRDLKLCRKLGLSAILMPSENAGGDKNYVRQWRTLSDEEIDRRIRVMVKSGGNDSTIKGYFIMDEPSVADFPALGKAVAAVKKYAPDKFAYINLFPNYATLSASNHSQLGTTNYIEYLERFVREVNPPFISYDNYKVEVSQDLQNTKEALSYYRNLLEVRRVAQAHHLPYLNIVTANQIRPFSTPPSPANLIFQAYTTLAAGYRGVGWFTYFQRNYHYAPIDVTGHKTQTWPWLQDVNRQIATLAPVMSRLTSTAVFFNIPPTGDLPLVAGNIIESVTCTTPLMIGEFTDPAGKQYAMIVNLSLEKSAKFTLKTKLPMASMKIFSTMDGSYNPYDTKAGQWLVAGQGVLLSVD